MKKLIILVTALAMVACFLPQIAVSDVIPAPKDESTLPSDTANLNLKVTFDLGQEPIDDVIRKILDMDKALEEIAADSEMAYKKALESTKPADYIQELKSIHSKVEEILKELEKLAMGEDGNLDPKVDELLRTVYSAGRELLGIIEGYIAKLQAITPEKPEPVIAIELDNPNLNFEGMKLGEERNTLFGIANTGNIPVRVDIGYASYGDSDFVYPSTTKGVNTYVTMVDDGIVPDGRIYQGRVDLGYLYPATREGRTLYKKFRLSFAAPTLITVPVEALNVSYELRAYPAEEIVEITNGEEKE